MHVDCMYHGVPSKQVLSHNSAGLYRQNNCLEVRALVTGFIAVEVHLSLESLCQCGQSTASKQHNHCQSSLSRAGGNSKHLNLEASSFSDVLSTVESFNIL